MKVGIITFHRTTNYGGILQAYALLKTLKEIGYEAEIIDYWPEYREEFHSQLHRNFKKISIIRKIKAIVRYLIKYRRNKIKYKSIFKFLSEHFNVRIQALYRNGEDIPTIYDAVIYGSDQIWRKYNLNSFKGYDDTYFGKFPLNCSKKITYAASMGTIDVDNSDKLILKSLLENLDSISVRELHLQKLIKDEFNLDSTLVCDPTLLLTKDEWIRLMENKQSALKRPCNKKYILYYNITKSQNGYQIAEYFAKKLNLIIIEIPQPVEKSIFGQRNAGTAGPSEFLNFVYFADYVVSSSFHGVAFSLIFEKQFVAVGMEKNSNRVQTVLSQLNLEDRFVNSIDQVVSIKPINYSSIDHLLAKYREDSISYLKDNLNP
jgi:hypothetical protein